MKPVSPVYPDRRYLPAGAEEIVFAKDQPQYIPLPAVRLPGTEGDVVTRWELTDEELKIIQISRSIFLEMMTFNRPLTPVRLSVVASDDCGMSFTEPQAVEPTQTKCRALDDGSCHVEYATTNEGKETKNLTHAQEIEVDDTCDGLDVGWIADTGPFNVVDAPGLIRLMVSGAFGYDLDHQITPETAEQLSDMFARAAVLARAQLKEVALAQEQAEQEAREIAARQQSLF